MKSRWITYVASRYVGGKISSASVFSVLGIAVGVLALTVIISVMNGFQLGFIESILEVSSGHIRAENFPAGEERESLIRRIESLPQVRSALPFREANVLLRGRFAGVRGANLRAVPPDALKMDPALAERLEMEDGIFDLETPNSVVLGAELARYLGVRAGGRVSVLSITGGLSSLAEEDENGENPGYIVTGIFRSGFYEYDLGWGFINMEQAENLFPSGQNTVLQVKLNNRWQDRQALNAIAAIAGSNPEINLISWREYNRAFFGALRTEKLMMFILVGLIFIVVSLNIFQSQRRFVLQRREEIGLLKALGASDRAVRLIFVFDGFIIGGLGAGLGLGLGLLLSFNIRSFFAVLESIVNFFISIFNMMLGVFGASPVLGEFEIFSPQVFYIKEISARVIPEEALMIFLFGFLSALLAAWIASFKASRTKPAEVLRYE